MEYRQMDAPVFHLEQQGRLANQVLSGDVRRIEWKGFGAMPPHPFAEPDRNSRSSNT